MSQVWKGREEEERGAREEGVEPVLVAGLGEPALPALGPGVGKVHDQDQLHEDEGEAAEEPKVHPGGAEGAVRDEEGPDAAADNDEVLDAPEAVLPAGPRIPGGLHPDHDQRHEREEERHDKTEPVDGEVPDGVGALDLEMEDLRETGQ